MVCKLNFKTYSLFSKETEIRINASKISCQLLYQVKQNLDICLTTNYFNELNVL